LERFEVRRILQPETPSQSAAYSKWRALIAQKNIPSVVAQAGLNIELDQRVTLEMLAPSVARLRSDAATFSFADSASIDEQAEFVLDTMTSTVLVAPRKLAAEFLQAVNPSLVVLFVGTSERDQPSPALLETLADTMILRTDERGTIEMIGDDKGLRVKTTK
jgi:hypothetical protein